MAHTKPLSVETRIAKLVLWCAAPTTLCLSLLLLLGDYSNLLRITLIPAALLLWWFAAWLAKDVLEKQFFGVANVLEALRCGDYSARLATQEDASAWQQIHSELNKLAQTLQGQRFEHLQASLLLDKLIAQFDVPVLVFDGADALRNFNQQTEVLLQRNRDELQGRSATQLGMGDFLSQPSGNLIEHRFPARGGRWELRRTVFRQDGKRFSLLLLNDLSRTLREEERRAWQRLVRVLGHELNNSLASINSVAEMLAADSQDNPQFAHFDKGLGLIQERTQALQRFTESYTRLAKLPPPKKASTAVSTLLADIGAQFPHADLGLNVARVNDTQLCIDGDQIKQVLINLVKNALESGADQPQVKISWQLRFQGVVIRVEDNGSGISNSDNLFVPFYTTKADGSGIGLYLSRQIVEAHGGILTLQNRADSHGCIAELWLPLGTISRSA